MSAISPVKACAAFPSRFVPDDKSSVTREARNPSAANFAVLVPRKGRSLVRFDDVLVHPQDRP